MSKNRQWQKHCEKKLSLENLESRQLLSAVPFTANTDLVESAAIYAESDDVYVNLSVPEEETPVALEANNVELLNDVEVHAVGKKLTIQFEASVNEKFTVVVWGTDLANQKESIAVKSVKASSKNTSGGVLTYNFSGKENRDYEVLVFKGKVTAKQFKNDNIPDDVEYVGSDYVTTLTPFSFVASPDKATEDSITFQQKLGKSGTPWYDDYSLDDLTISAKFDGDRSASVYTVDGGELVCGNRSYGIEENEDGSITISGLKPHQKQTFQVAFAYDNAISAYSKSLSISTTKAQKAAPEDVAVELTYDENLADAFAVTAYDGSAKVTWTGETSATYTVMYAYTNDNGKLITKTATKKATVNKNGEGEYTVTKLLANKQYTFSVKTNKTKDFDASVAVDAEDENYETLVTTPTSIATPSLKKDSTTSTSISFKISNWDKIEKALQTVDEYGDGGILAVSIVKKGQKIDKYQPDAIFTYYKDDSSSGWDSLYGDDSMVITRVKNKNTATVTIGGLNANTEYTVVATALSGVQTNKINTVTPATSKSLNIKTAKN